MEIRKSVDSEKAIMYNVQFVQLKIQKRQLQAGFQEGDILFRLQGRTKEQIEEKRNELRVLIGQSVMRK